MTLGDRIKKARALKKISRADLSKLCLVPYSTISEIENNDQKTSTKIVEIALALGVSPEWLATGKGQMPHGLNRSPYSVVSSDDDESGIPIKFSDVRGSCGGGAINGDELDRAPLIKEPSWFKRYKIKPKDALAVWADGDSMSEYIVDGDIAIFDTSKKTPKSGCIYLIQHPDGTKIKKLRLGFDGSWILESNNPDKRRFPDERIPPDQADLLIVLGEFVYRQGG